MKNTSETEICQLGQQYDLQKKEIEKKKKKQEYEKKVFDAQVEEDERFALTNLAARKEQELSAGRVADAATKKEEKKKLADIAEDETKATIRKKDEDQKVKEHESTLQYKLEKKKIDQFQLLYEEIRKISRIEDNQSISLEEVQQLKSADLKIALARKEDEVAKIQHENVMRKKNAEQFDTEVLHNHKMRETIIHSFALILQRLFEREILLAYSNLQSGEKNNLLKNLGEQLTKIMEGGEGLVESLRIISFPGTNQENPLLKMLSRVAETLFQTSSFVPTVKELLDEFLHDGISGQAAGDEKQTGKSDNAKTGYNNY